MICKYLLKVLCPVSRPITTLDCVLLKDNSRAPIAGSGPEINSRACLCVLQGPLYLETALHVLGGTSTHHQELIQLYLQHLVFVTLLLLLAAIVKVLEQLFHDSGR